MSDGLIKSLIDDWHWLTTELPTPQRPEGRSSNTVNYGHPAQWASDTADEIAELLASFRDLLWERMGAEVPYGHVDHNARGSTWRIRRTGFLKLAEYFLAPENAGLEDIRSELDTDLFERMENIHNQVLSQRTLPQPAVTSIPCVRCSSALNRDWGPPARYACSGCEFSISLEDFPAYADALKDVVVGGADPVLVTIKYAANFYGVPYKRIEKLIERGKVQRHGKDADNRVLIDKREVESVLGAPPTA